MNKHEANIIIHERIMGKCWHEWKRVWREHRPKCGKCGEYKKVIADSLPPNYCDDANEALEVWDSFHPGLEVQSRDGIWCTINTWEGVGVSSNADFCLAICTAALRTLGITEDIEL